MSYLLDTNACIRYLNGHSENIKARLERLTPEDVVLYSVVKAELLYGAGKSNAGERTFARLNGFFNLFKSLPLTIVQPLYTARFASIWRDMDRRSDRTT